MTNSRIVSSDASAEAIVAIGGRSEERGDKLLTNGLNPGGMGSRLCWSKAVAARTGAIVLLALAMSSNLSPIFAADDKSVKARGFQFRLENQTYPSAKHCAWPVWVLVENGYENIRGEFETDTNGNTNGSIRCKWEDSAADKE